jgi:hypothetical protein
MGNGKNKKEKSAKRQQQNPVTKRKNDRSKQAVELLENDVEEEVATLQNDEKNDNDVVEPFMTDDHSITSKVRNEVDENEERQHVDEQTNESAAVNDAKDVVTGGVESLTTQQQLNGMSIYALQVVRDLSLVIYTCLV